MTIGYPPIVRECTVDIDVLKFYSDTHRDTITEENEQGGEQF